jgi:ankyrin repeat protein
MNATSRIRPVLLPALVMPALVILLGRCAAAQPAAVDRLCQAAVRNDVPTIKALITDQPNVVNERNRGGFSPLHLAAQGGQYEAAETLVEYNANIHLGQARFEGAPLQYAASRGHVWIVRLLLRRGAEVDSRDTNGRTPLIWAVMGQHHEVAEELLEHGADPLAANRGGWRPIDYANARGDGRMVRLLARHMAP